LIGGILARGLVRKYLVKSLLIHYNII